MTSSEASRTHATGVAAIESQGSQEELNNDGRGSRDSLARPIPTLAPGLTGPLTGSDSLREINNGMPLLTVNDCVLEEADSAVTEADGSEAEQKKDNEEEMDGIPYDRGWSWMLVLGMFIIFLLMAGYIKSSGIFFVELLTKFNAPATHTALLFSIRSAVFSVAGLYVMNVCLGVFGSRKLVFTGGLMMSLSAILSSVANELTLLICIYSILFALGMSMVISPGEVLVGHYFKQRRSLALSLAKCGSSIGNVAIPPLVSYLLKEYGLSGTLLLCGGLCLHSLPAAMLLRPTSFYTKRRNHRNLCTGGAGSGSQPLLSKQVNSNNKVIHADGETVALRLCKSDPESCAFQRGMRGSVGEDAAGSKIEERQHGLPCRRETSAPVGKTAAVVTEDSDVKPNTQLPITQGPVTGPRQLDLLTADLAALSTSNPEICSRPPRHVPLRKRTYSEPPEKSDPTHGRTAEEKTSVLDAISQSSVVRYMSVTSLDTSMGLLSANIGKKPLPVGWESVDSGIGVEQSATGDKNSPNHSRHCCAIVTSFLWRCPKKLVFMLDFSLFRSPLFRLMMMYMIFSQFVNMVLDYLPAVAKENGVTETQSALLLSVIGGLDLLSRLLCGFLADTRLVRVSTMIAITLVILAVVTQFVRFMTSFHHFVILAVFQGLFGGAGNCLIPVLVIDFVGLENMGKAIGFCQLVMGAAMAVIYPFLGYMRDVSGSFTTVFHIIGMGMLVAAGFLCLEGPVRRLESKSQSPGPAGPDFELVVYTEDGS